MKKHNILSLLLAIVLVVTLLSACSGGGDNPSPTTSEPAAKEPSTEETTVPTQDVMGNKTTEDTGFERKTKEGTLTVGTTGAVVGFDTINSTNTFGNELVYEQLLNRNTDTMEFECVLADSYEYTDDTTLVFHLRNDVYFSNGEPLEAEDVIWSFQRIVESGGRLAAYYTFIDYDASYCEDEYTVVFKLNYAYGPALANIALNAILNKTATEEMSDEDYWDKPVGTGPYSVVENISGSHTAYALREAYWNKDAVPEPELITVKSYSDTTTMFIDFENGVLDVITNIASTDVARLVNNEVTDCSYVLKSLPDTYLMTFASYCEPLQDINVRKAICHAIDFQAVGAAALGYMALPASSTMPSDLPWHVDVGTYEFNPELAAQYLSESTYSAGEISLSLVIVNNLPSNAVIAEAIQAYLAEIGIDVVVESYDMPTAIGKFMGGECDLTLKMLPTGVGTLDPQGFYSTLDIESTNQSVRVDSDEFQQYMRDSVYTTEAATREEAYTELQQWLYDNYMHPPVCESAACYAYRNYITHIGGVTPMQLRLRDVTF